LSLRELGKAQKKWCLCLNDRPEELLLDPKYPKYSIEDIFIIKTGDIHTYSMITKSVYFIIRYWHRLHLPFIHEGHISTMSCEYSCEAHQVDESDKSISTFYLKIKASRTKILYTPDDQNWL
jgi:hypothetical protein